MTTNKSRPSGRACDELREIVFTRNYTSYAEGSVLSCFGNTRVLCTASIENSVPTFLKGKKCGWLSAEYSMLPRATAQRNTREVLLGRQSGRSHEIQRLIGRSLRACLDLKTLGARTIAIDCDVLQADGGTRTAAISGSYIALHDAVTQLLKKKVISQNPIHGMVAAVSVGIYQGLKIIDLDYQEDSTAETDMNLVFNDAGHFIEIQGTAEGHAFQREELDDLLTLGQSVIQTIIDLQRKSLEL